MKVVDDLRGKFAGVVLGTAIGDSLGYPVEFLGIDAIQKKYGERGVVDLPVRPLYSDDTQMFRAVCEGLLRAGPAATLDKAAEEIAAEFIAWSKSPDNNRAPGASCLEGCANLSGGIPWRMAGREGSTGCGAAMRSMAYGMWFWDRPELAAEWAATHALMTHRSHEAQASAAAVAAGVAAGIETSDWRYVADAMIEAALQYDMRTSQMLVQAVDDVTKFWTDPSIVLDRWRGWTGAEAVAASLFCALRGRTYRHAVLLAVNSPGDSDTLGAITGALSGAVDGAIDNIPSNWIPRVEKSQELTTLAVRVWKAWHQDHGIAVVPMRRGREKPIGPDHVAEIVELRRG